MAASTDSSAASLSWLCSAASSGRVSAATARLALSRTVLCTCCLASITSRATCLANCKEGSPLPPGNGNTRRLSSGGSLDLELVGALEIQSGPEDATSVLSAGDGIVRVDAASGNGNQSAGAKAMPHTLPDTSSSTPI